MIARDCKREFPTRPQYSPHLRQRPIQVRDVLKDGIAEDHIETGTRIRHSPRVAKTKLMVPTQSLRHPQILSGRVKTEEGTISRHDDRANAAIPAPQIQHSSPKANMPENGLHLHCSPKSSSRLIVMRHKHPSENSGTIHPYSPPIRGFTPET